MKAIKTAQANFQQTLRVVNEMQDAKTYEVYYDANLFECDENEVEEGNYVYTSRDLAIINEMHEANRVAFFSAIETAGYIVTMPYNDSIYITRNGKNAISLRNHRVAGSTLNHWESVIAVDINSGDVTQYLDMI
jgi:hypothetical protein